MVAGLDDPIEVPVALRQEDRIAIKRRGHIYQVEKGLPNQQVPDPAAVLPGHETRHVARLCFYRDVLPCPPHMQLSLAVLVHLKTSLVSPLAEAAASFSQQRRLLVNGRA